VGLEAGTRQRLKGMPTVADALAGLGEGHPSDPSRAAAQASALVLDVHDSRLRDHGESSEAADSGRRGRALLGDNPSWLGAKRPAAAVGERLHTKAAPYARSRAESRRDREQCPASTPLRSRLASAEHSAPPTRARCNYYTTPSRRSRAISAAPNPSPLSTSSVCSPKRAGGVRIDAGVSESLIGGPGIMLLPSPTTIPRWRTWGSANVSSSVLTGPKQISFSPSS